GKTPGGRRRHNGRYFAEPLVCRAPLFRFAQSAAAKRQGARNIGSVPKGNRPQINLRGGDQEITGPGSRRATRRYDISFSERHPIRGCSHWRPNPESGQTAQPDQYVLYRTNPKPQSSGKGTTTCGNSLRPWQRTFYPRARSDAACRSFAHALAGGHQTRRQLSKEADCKG